MSEEDWTLIDGRGPGDIEPVPPMTLDEIETDTPAPGVVIDPVQDVRPPRPMGAAPATLVSATTYINAAKGQVGYREGPGNDTVYGRWYGMNGQPYCAMGLSWTADRVGALPAIGGRWAYCPYWAAWARRVGAWHTDAPQRGDVVFFDWSGLRRSGHEAHVGLVTATKGSTITTVEFNTVSGSGNQSDGGGVYARSRALSTTVGFLRPAWAVERPTAIVAARGHALLVVDGAWGPATTRRLQDVLRARSTGVMDAATIRALSVWLRQAPVTAMTVTVRSALQSRVGAVRDGVIGPATVKALQRYLNRI